MNKLAMAKTALCAPNLSKDQLPSNVLSHRRHRQNISCLYEIDYLRYHCFYIAMSKSKKDPMRQTEKSLTRDRLKGLQLANG